MKNSLKALLILAVMVLAAWLIAPRLSQLVPAGTDAGKSPISSVVTAVIGGLLMAVLVFLIPERWKRIESEMLSLREAQVKTLDDVRKRADERINEKLDSATRQAQAIREHVSNLADRYPWIKGIADAEFTPDSCSCQIVLRNAMKFVSQGQDGLAHEYLFGWTRSDKDHPVLEGSVYDFYDLARFSAYVLKDEYLALLMLGEGYRESARQLLIAPTYLKNLLRLGMFSDAMQLADAIRQRTFPTWKEHLKKAWQGWIRTKRLSQKDVKPIIDEYTAFALFKSFAGDKEAVARSIEKARALSTQRRDKVMVMLNEAECAAVLGDVNHASTVTASVEPEQVNKLGLSYELVWALRRCGEDDSSDQILQNISSEMQKKVMGHEDDNDDAKVVDETMRQPETASLRIEIPTPSPTGQGKDRPPTLDASNPLKRN